MKTAFSNLQIGLIVCILLFGCRQKNMDKQDGDIDYFFIFLQISELFFVIFAVWKQRKLF